MQSAYLRSSGRRGLKKDEHQSVRARLAGSGKAGSQKMTARALMGNVFMPLLMWPSMVAAQAPTTVQQITDVIVQLCMAGGSAHTIAGDAAGISIRTYDLRRNPTGEFNIAKSNVDGVVSGINNSVPQLPTDQANKVRGCLLSLRDELL